MASPKTPLTVVPAVVDAEQLERTLKDFAENQAPMVCRATLARQKAEAEVQALENDLSSLHARRDLATRAFNALMEAMGRDEADILKAIGIYSAGLTQNVLAAAE